MKAEIAQSLGIFAVVKMTLGNKPLLVVNLEKTAASLDPS